MIFASGPSIKGTGRRGGSGNLKDRTKRFYNNVNAETIKSIEELVSAIALIHNLLLQSTRGGVIPG